jgi:hypothetical protein
VNCITCYGCGGPHRMRHCERTSVNMRSRIWALLRRRDETPAGAGKDGGDHGVANLPGLTTYPIPAERTQEAPAVERGGGAPPGWVEASDGEPPDGIFLEEAAATARPLERGRAGWPSGDDNGRGCIGCGGNHDIRA